MENTRQSFRQAMALLTYALSAAFAALCLTCVAPPAFAVSNVCPSGTCDISNPIYVNVYWDQNQDKWNSDISATDTHATVGALDDLTDAICHSAYFGQLSQYSVKSCHTLPSIVESGCGRVPTDIDSAHDRLDHFGACVISHHPEFDVNRTILNVFLPPQTTPVANSDFCNKFSGYHDKFGSPVEITFIPTNSHCNGSIDTISKTLTHEMVEAATDPVPNSPTGWKIPFATDDEVADQCENRKPSSSQFLYGRVALYFSDLLNRCTDSFDTTQPVKLSKISACGSGSQMKITIQGKVSPSPWDLVGDHAGGSKTLFLDAAVNGSQTWSAGKLEPPPADLVGLGRVQWQHIPARESCSAECEAAESTCMNDAHDSGERQACVFEKSECEKMCKTEPAPKSGDTIIVHGFNDRYGTQLPGGTLARVQPKDKITFTVSSWLNGGSDTATVEVPGPNEVKNFRFRPEVHHSLPVYVGDSVELSGRLVDTGNDGSCGVESMELTPKSDYSADTFYPVKEETLGDGSFSFEYTTGGRAGEHHVRIPSPVSAELIVPVHPVADSLSNSVGGTIGGQVITLEGNGFAAGATKVSFASGQTSVDAPNINVVNHHTIQVTTPPSPIQNNGAGVVDVRVSVDGLKSTALSYRYVVPNRPVFTFTAACRIVEDAINSLTVSAYNADGSTAAETISLVTTDAVLENISGQFVSNLTINPGATIQIKGVGPVTATPSADSHFAVTAKFKEGPPCNLPSPQNYRAVDAEPTDAPETNGQLSAQTSQDRQVAIWGLNQNVSDSASSQNDFVVLGEFSKVSAPEKQIDVSVLNGPSLRAVLRDAPNVIANSQQGDHHIRFMGPNLSIAAKVTDSKGGLSSPARISFGLTRYPDIANYQIAYLPADGTTWIQVIPSQANDERQSLQAKINQPGIYALIRIEP